MRDLYSRETLVLEAKVIMDALMAPETIAETRALVSREMFHDKTLADLWGKVVNGWIAGSPLNETVLMTIGDVELRKLLIDNIVGSGAAVGTLNNARELRNLHVCRKAYTAGSALMRKATESMTEADDLINLARASLSSMEENHYSQHTQELSEAISSLAVKLEDVRIKFKEGARSFIPTGFKFLDNWFKGGLREGNVMVVAARPGVGKTSVLLSMMLSMVRFGFKVKLYSLEMPASELAEKIMYNLGGLRPYMMQTGQIDQEKWDQAVLECRNYGLWIEDSMNNIDDILADAAIAHQQGVCDIALMDHLRLLRVSDVRVNSSIYARTCEITGKLKHFALLQQMPVIYACQLNRDSAREDRDPDLQDLRDSGSIEEDADKIVFLRRKKITENDFQIKMIIGKHRQGGGAREHIFLDTNDTYSGFIETETDRSVTLGSASPVNPVMDAVRGKQKSLGTAVPEDLPLFNN